MGIKADLLGHPFNRLELLEQPADNFVRLYADVDSPLNQMNQIGRVNSSSHMPVGHSPVGASFYIDLPYYDRTRFRNGYILYRHRDNRT